MKSKFEKKRIYSSVVLSVILLTLSFSCSEDGKKEHFFYQPPIWGDSKTVNEMTSRNLDVAPTQLKVTSGNLWGGGHMALKGKGILSILKKFKEENPDIIGLQEDGEEERFLAQNLNFYLASFKNGKSILSRYPIIRSKALRYGVVSLISIGKSFLIVASIHLPSYPYGPYYSCYDRSSSEVLEEVEMQNRGRHLYAILEEIENSFIQKNEKEYPIIVMGDFNTPSHLDWPYDTHNKSKVGCRFDHFYPVTKMMSDYHYTDSFRDYHKSVEKVPGYTWSSITKISDFEGRYEPQDRIDYIFKRGSLIETIVSKVQEIPMTDHYGVTSIFNLYSKI